MRGRGRSPRWSRGLPAALHACCPNFRTFECVGAGVPPGPDAGAGGCPLLYTPAVQRFERSSAQVFPPDQTLEQAVKLATRIAEMPQPAAIMGKEVRGGGYTPCVGRFEWLNG
jgi:hypothetical protein